MDTCATCRDLLWDDLFGLLEAGESARLHRHVAGCTTCQAEWANAQCQHALVTEAARLEVALPPFTLPADEEMPPAVRAARVSAAVDRPSGRRWAWLGLAAAVLLLLGLPFGLYQYGRHHYAAAWHEAEEQVAQLLRQRQELQAEANSQPEQLQRQALAHHVRIQVVGPAVYQPGAANPYRVWVTNLVGAPMEATLTAHLLEGKNALPIAVQKASANGTNTLLLPARLPLTPDSTPRLEVQVQDPGSPAPVQTYLRVLPPAFRTRLAVDKPVYRSGDPIYFRSLTLERFGQKKPEHEFTVVYRLADAHGKEYQTLRGRTLDGIGTGIFNLSPRWPAGEYTLTVTEAEQQFPAAVCRFWVGPVEPQQPEQPTPAGTPQRLTVEFFPEGGALVAGVDNRVYFRVRDALGRPAPLQATLVDSQGQPIAGVGPIHTEPATAGTEGLGQFTLQPQVGATYALRASAPPGSELHADFPPVQAEGVTMHVPPVAGLREPIRAIVQQVGPAAALVIGLFCQGRLVAQELVPAGCARAEVRLAPLVSCSGVCRVTVFRERQGQLQPVAERLTYRPAEERLTLSVHTEKSTYAPGERVKLHIGSANEKGRPEPAWFLVSAVDQAVLKGRAQAASPTVPAYFHLSAELPQPEELEQAELLVSDSQEAPAAVDLFLGTQGWRRFANVGMDPVVVREPNKDKPRAQDLAVSAIVKLDNGEQVARQYALEVDRATAELHARLAREDQELVQRGKEWLTAAQTAAGDLQAFQERAAGLMRLGLAGGGFVLFATGCALLLLGLLRLLRGAAAQRGYLVIAMAAFVLCVLTLRVPGQLGQGTATAGDAVELTRMQGQLESLLAFAARPVQEQRPLGPSTLLARGFDSLSSATSKQRLARMRPGEEERKIDDPPKPGVGPLSHRPFLAFVRPSREAPAPAQPQTQALRPSLPIRSYAYPSVQDRSGKGKPPTTLLWQPALRAEDGTAEVSFGLPSSRGTYRIQVQGHSADGRLGMVSGTLECRPGDASGK